MYSCRVKRDPVARFEGSCGKNLITVSPAILRLRHRRCAPTGEFRQPHFCTVFAKRTSGILTHLPGMTIRLSALALMPSLDNSVFEFIRSPSRPPHPLETVRRQLSKPQHHLVLRLIVGFATTGIDILADYSSTSLSMLECFYKRLT
jgi:hypothetical protein